MGLFLFTSISKLPIFTWTIFSKLDYCNSLYYNLYQSASCQPVKFSLFYFQFFHACHLYSLSPLSFQAKNYYLSHKSTIDSPLSTDCLRIYFVHKMLRS